MPKAKYKHNKKRNTGFLYTVLLQELTKSIFIGDKSREKNIKKILCEYFSSNKELYKELKIYNQFKQIENLSPEEVRSLLNHSKFEHSKLDKNILNESKIRLVHTINKNLGKSIYDSFVSNYRILATLEQLFSDNCSMKEKVLIETKFINDLESNKDGLYSLPTIDNLVFKTFVSKFNEKYSELLNEQKILLTKYISSFDKNNIEFKYYLNEEINRMKMLLEGEIKDVEIKANKDKIVEKLNEFRSVEITQEMLSNILKIQELVNKLCQSN